MDKVLITVVLLLICQTFNVRSQVAIDRNLRIVGGSVARAGQFPHTVALILHLVQSRSSFCGGSIIHQNFVLTVSVELSIILIVLKENRNKVTRKKIMNQFNVR